jgi:hypothetical protein
MVKDLTGASTTVNKYNGFDPENPFRISMPNVPREKYDEMPVLPEEITPEEVKHVDQFITEVKLE